MTRLERLVTLLLLALLLSGWTLATVGMRAVGTSLLGAVAVGGLSMSLVQRKSGNRSKTLKPSFNARTTATHDPYRRSAT